MVRLKPSGMEILLAQKAIKLKVRLKDNWDDLII